MCKGKEHVFVAYTPGPPAVATRCICGLFRWGTDDELRALDEIAMLERLAAMPAKETP